MGLVLRPSLFEVLSAKRETASTASGESLALSGLSSIDLPCAHSTLPSTLPSTPSLVAESLSDHGSPLETEMEVIGDEEATSIEGEGCMIIEEESTLAASQARRGSVKVSVVIPIHSSPVKQELEEEEVSQGLLVEECPVLVSQPQRCSQNKSHVEHTLRDTLDEEEIIYEDSEDGVNEQLLAEKQDLILWNRSSSRPLRRSSQRVSYAMADDIESEEDQDDISIFEGSDKGVAIESDEDEFSDGAASSSNAENEPASDDSEVEQVEIVATATAKPKKKSITSKSTAISREGRGIDLNLPPPYKIEDIIQDMLEKALTLGLESALEGLGDRPLNIATMCSGTGTTASVAVVIRRYGVILSVFSTLLMLT